jgi:hypothetical protein
MKPMKKPIIAAAAVLATLIAVPLASANAPVLPALAVRTVHLAVEVRAEHECMAAAQRRMESRHHRWEDQARVTGEADEAHFDLQLEHENILDGHRALVERHEWLLIREAAIRRSVRRAGSRLTAAERARAERGLAAIAAEEEEIEAEHHRLLGAHERISRQHDEIVDVYAARSSRIPAGTRVASR